MKRTWPKDNLLDDMADEYAEMLYPNWNFRRYGVKNPWAFRLACRDALVITDDGDPLLDPKRLVEAMDHFMKDDVREKEDCLADDEEVFDDAEIRRMAVESIIREAVDNRSYSDEEIAAIEGFPMLERLKDWFLESFRETANDLLEDAIVYCGDGSFPATED